MTFDHIHVWGKFFLVLVGVAKLEPPPPLEFPAVAAGKACTPSSTTPPAAIGPSSPKNSINKDICLLMKIVLTNKNNNQ